jgi:hypothetical protein
MSDAAGSDDQISNQEPKPGASAPLGLPARAEVERPQNPEPAECALISYYRPASDERPFFADEGIPNYAAREDIPVEPQSVRAPRDWRRLRAAASLAAVVAIAGVAAAEHVHVLRVARADQAQTHALAHRLDAMTTRLESLESNRSRDELASLRKVLAEIKSSAASTRDVGGAVGQLASRVDKLEKDQGARLDKLGDRIDHDAAARLSDITARLDRLEAKASAPVVAAVAAKAVPASKPAAAKADPGVSYEATGAIDRAPVRLRRFSLAEIHNGYAMIESPAGEFVVAPGDVVPGGGGRVLRIERHGRDWVVITTQGQIVASDN